MIKKLTCIGAGFVGAPLGAVIADRCPEIQVTVVDKNKERIDAWNSKFLPLYEPGLEEIISGIRQRRRVSVNAKETENEAHTNGLQTPNHHSGHSCNLTFSTDVETAIEEAELIMLCIDTPTKTAGIGSGVAPDLTNLQAAVRTIGRVAKTDKIIVEKSTVPCGTAQALRDLLDSGSQGACRFEVLSNPEFLSEGTTISDLLRPSRILIGCQETASGYEAAEKLAAIYRQWTPGELIITMDQWSSELTKLAANAILAQRVSSINSLSAICEAVGADIDSVSKSCGMDPRIGKYMLKCSLGWGGGCFHKDVLSLVYLARSLGLNQVAEYWYSVVQMNEYQKSRFLERIVTCMHGSVGGKSIALLGFAFKKNTSDTKNSAVIALVKGLLADGARVSVYDPMVDEAQIRADVNASPNESTRLRVSSTAYDACGGVDAVVVATEWDEFRTPTKTPTNITSKEVEQDAEQGGSQTTSRPSLSRCLTPESDENLLFLRQRDPETLDWRRILDSMPESKFVFDGRNMLDGIYLAGLGCRYVRIGRSSQWDHLQRIQYPATK